eukprot:8408408-Pyramimonas_sp.AAC.1
MNPSSKLPLHRPLQRFISSEGTASLEDTLEDPEACQNIVFGISKQRVNLTAASWRSGTVPERHFWNFNTANHRFPDTSVHPGSFFEAKNNRI